MNRLELNYIDISAGLVERRWNATPTCAEQRFKYTVHMKPQNINNLL